MKYNPLYDKGFHRVGCIGCPLSTRRYVELELYPIYKQNYKKALQKLIDKRKAEGKTAKANWNDVESLYKWWIQDDTLDGQLSLFDEVEK
jgi:phosphoadenosine phosphosulfate reductase